MLTRWVILLIAIISSLGIVYPVIKFSDGGRASSLFIFLVLFLDLWIVSSHLVDAINLGTMSYNKGAAISASVFGGLSVNTVSSLSMVLGGVKSESARVALKASGALIIIGALLPGSIYGVYRNSTTSVGVTYGPYNYIWVLGCFISIIILVWSLWGSTRKDRKNYRLMRVVSMGVLSAVFIGFAANLVLPYITKSYATTQIAPLVTIIISSVFGYGIVAYRVFDLRASVFRAVGYSLSIVSLVILYTSALYGVILPFSQPGAKFNLSTLILILVGTMATIYLYDKIKEIFDLITDKLFFKNSYKLTDFLDKFNQSLINSGDVKELAESINEILSEDLKTGFTVLGIKHDQYELTIDSRSEEERKHIDEEVAKAAIYYHFTTGSRLMAKEVINKNKFKELSTKLNEKDYAIIIDLGGLSKKTSSRKSAMRQSEDLKFLALGPKRSGEGYNSQDFEALRIVSKELVIALQNAMRVEEIKIFNEELQHKIELATKKLRVQNKKLVEADELKDDFLSIASHQMRTPISTINGYASILGDGDAGKLNTNQIKFAKTIEDSTKKLSYLINDFLTVSRLKSGKFSIDRVNSNLSQVLRNEAKDIEQQFKVKGVKLKLNIDSNIPKIYADELKLRQVMMNLMDNALHYTKEGGEVDVKLTRQGKNITFEVSDSGIGVPKEEQKKLFTKMFRADNAQKMRPDGTGLGLYLAKKVVMGHGGHIIFRSKEGVGSTFGFVIPALKA